jgi:primosomal protein N' (replication factor Y)
VLPPSGGGRGRHVGPRLTLVAGLTTEGRAALREGARLGSRQRTALERLAGTPGGELDAAALAGDGVDRATLRRLESRGLVVLREQRSFRRPAVVAVGARRPRPALTPAQDAAVAGIVAAIDGAGPRELLLYGVTGSGKTEVYLAAAEATLARDRTVIALVPEIALTPQIVSRFTARFGDRVALLHSGLSDGERRDEWERLRSGDARICVGPRSAVFAPLAGLGLIVIDEEHDASYKQEGDPRYDARDVARRRATVAQAALVAGSATPRPESWLALDRLDLPHRVDGRELPPVEVLDMRGVTTGALHPSTAAALAGLRAEAGKAIVLINRRGWSPFLSCRSCGQVWECPECDVSLVLHRAAGALRCHHCGHSEPVPDACRGCGSVTLARQGAGTERAADLIAEVAGELPVFRLDSDSAARSGAHNRILAEFERAETGVLVGTQMVAKGHDFPDVVLSVVLDADATLRFPDFRAEERTFALVSQLAGRCGRGTRGGRVLVQTLTPGAAAIRSAAAHDAAGFVAGELERRRGLSYPPFASLIRVDLGAEESATVEIAAARIHDALATELPPDARLLGPAPRFRLRGRHRRQLLVKAGGRPEAVAAVRASVEAMAASRELRGVSISVDVEPQ